MALTSLLRRSKPPTIPSVLSLAISSFSTQCFVPTEAPPIPKTIPFARQDPYRWMRNRDDTDFLNFLERENSYAQAFMADTEALRRDLVSKMKARIPAEIQRKGVPSSSV